MATYALVLLLVVKGIWSNDLMTHYDGQCSSWRYSDAFYIKAASLAESAVLQRVESRSFVECCVTCKSHESCSGVTFTEGECSLIDGTAAAPGFVVSDGSADDLRVMVYSTTDGLQKEHYCAGECELCQVATPPDCKLLHDNGFTADGVYTISPGGSQMYCDMSRGGWTAIQRRVDNSVDFYRGWADYVAGFGDLSGNFWAGLDMIHALTSAQPCELYVYMESFEAETAWAQYSTFSVGDASSGYLLTVGGYTGTAGDSLALQNNHRFTTHDNDQDVSGQNCAKKFKGAWWYEACHHSNPNGRYLGGPHNTYADGVNWLHFKGHYYSLKTIEFLVRRK